VEGPSKGGPALRRRQTPMPPAMPQRLPTPLDLLAGLSVVVLLALLSVLWCSGAMLLGAIGGIDSSGGRWVIGAAAGTALWAWVIQQAVQVARVTRATGQRPASCPPDPVAILREYPPRVDDAAAVRAETAGSGGSKLHRAANEAVIDLLRHQIGCGRELGAQVFAYHRGR
jgi:hypothetical protein